MAHWRIGRGWSEAEIRRHLERAASLTRNFDEDPATLQNASGWYAYGSESVLGRGPAGPPAPGGPFQRACAALKKYEFSDRRIVRAYFDERAELLNRPMVLQLRAFRQLRFLTGVRVGDVAAEEKNGETIFGYRYDTLEGHIERGAEWFLLRKEHEPGTLRFRISAYWKPGDFPNWWSRVGFEMVGRYYQKKWHRHAHEFMARLVQESTPSSGNHPDLQPSLPNITFEERTANA